MQTEILQLARDVGRVDVSRAKDMLFSIKCKYVLPPALYHACSVFVRGGTLYRCLKKHIPPNKKTHGNISLENTKSGAGEQFLLLDCRLRVCVNLNRVLLSTGTGIALAASPFTLPISLVKQIDCLRILSLRIGYQTVTHW